MPSWLGEEVDVCIVGSGAGGAPMALELAKAGARVVVLEKGPWYKEGVDFDHDEIRNSRRAMWVPWISDEPHLLKTLKDSEPVPSTSGWIANCVGGGTIHMSGFFYRLHPDDFRLRSRYGELAGSTLEDWPIGYEELAPWYDKVEREVGVSGLAGGHPFEPPRSGPYPQPPLDENPLSGLVDQGARKLGWHPFKTPRAVLSTSVGERSECVYCDFCGSYGCESGAKGSTLAALLPRALATGRCELRPHSMAFEIATDAEGRATAVRYFDAAGAIVEQKAKVVVVSATSIESARLLLNSTSARSPTGLANSSGLVGKNLTFSTLAKGYGVFERGKLPEAMRDPHTIHFLQRSLRDHYFLAERKGEYDKGGTLNFLLPHRNPIYTAQRLSGRQQPALWGAALQKALHRFYHEVHELEFEVFGEYLPNPGTAVTVDGKVRDRWGIPVATIHLFNHPEDLRNSERVLQHGLEVFKAAGAAETGIETVGGTTFVLQHGTCRFGDNPAASVLNRFCQAHDVPNLYVVDGSFMPTSGGVPTTLTIMANSFRVAAHLVERLKAGGGEVDAGGR